MNSEPSPALALVALVVTVLGDRISIRGMERGPAWLQPCGWTGAALGFAWVLYSVAWWVMVS